MMIDDDCSDNDAENDMMMMIDSVLSYLAIYKLIADTTILEKKERKMDIA